MCTVTADLIAKNEKRLLSQSLKKVKLQYPVFPVAIKRNSVGKTIVARLVFHKGKWVLALNDNASTIAQQQVCYFMNSEKGKRIIMEKKNVESKTEKTNGLHYIDIVLPESAF